MFIITERKKSIIPGDVVTVPNNRKSCARIYPGVVHQMGKIAQLKDETITEL